jgi:thiol-disulfide isomerase/thioredoxin
MYKLPVMKSLFSFLIVLMIAAPGNAQKTPPSADAILQQAYGQATKENKKVFIIFHASWCGWCRKLDAALNDKELKDLFEAQYVIKHVTVLESDSKKNLENPGGETLYTQYGGQSQGLPYWLVFDEKGNLLADAQLRPEGAGLQTEGKNVGCPASEEEVAYFISVLKKTSTLTEAQLAKIEKRFRKNADE